MISEQQISTYIQEHIQGTGLVLVELKVSASGHIQVFIEHLQHVSIQHCIALSRYLESKLDRAVHDFALDVSSPGIDAPFRHPVQYEKYQGREVEVLLSDGRKMPGTYTHFDGTQLTFLPKADKKKKLDTSPIVLPLDKIKELKLILQFK